MTTPTTTRVRASQPQWTPIIALSFGIAMVVASEFLPASVLPTLASDIGVSEGTAGLAAAATAIAGALTAPTIAMIVPRADRRRVLIGLLVLAALSNLIVAAAPGLVVLLAGRLLLGAALAGYWAFAFGAGVSAMPGRANIVSAGIASGVSLATVIGVPVSSVVGDQLGWRTAFVGAAALTGLSAVVVAWALPPVSAHPGAGYRMMRQAVANKRLMAGIAGVAGVAFGNFTAYPYIRVAIERIDPSATTWLLLTWGIGGVVGTVSAGVLARWLRPLTAVTPVVLALGLLGTAVANSLTTLTIAVVLWGVAMNVIPVATQLWVTRVEAERAESAMGLQVTAFQVAITLGSALGGALLDGFGVRVPLVVGAAVAAAAGLLWAFLRIPDER